MLPILGVAASAILASTTLEAEQVSADGQGAATPKDHGTIIPYTSRPQILLAQAGTQSSSPVFSVSNIGNTYDSSFLKAVQDAIEKSIFTKQNGTVPLQGYFLRVSGTASEPVYYIESPTQFEQIVSEGMAYWLQILSTIALMPEIYKDATIAQQYYETAKGLIRGALSMLNAFGNMGWRCFFENGKIVFRSEDEKTSAADADLIFVGALMNFEKFEDRLFEAKVINEKAKFSLPHAVYDRVEDYAKAHKGKKARDIEKDLKFASVGDLIDFMVRGVKSFDVENLGERLILRVSDGWGGKDLKGNITSNSSYYAPAVLWQLSERYVGDSNFWLQLRRDEFEKLEQSYEFVHRLAEEIIAMKPAIPQKTNWVRLDGPQARLFESMARKIPSDDPDFSSFVEAKELEKDGDSLSFVLNKSIVVNKDGSRDIREDIFSRMVDKIQEYGLDNFFPDQVEVETDGNNFIVRQEVGAKNLDFTEGYDGIRIYAELGEDLLFNNDTDANIPPQYKISTRIAEFLKNKLMANKTPKSIRADRYHNNIAISCYTMAEAGLSFFTAVAGNLQGYLDEMNRYFSSDKTIFDYLTPGKKPTGAQYYNASLTLRLMASYLARKSDMTPNASENLTISTLIPPTEETGLSYQYNMLRHEDADFAINSFKNDAMSALSIVAPVQKDPVMKISAEWQYRQHKKANNGSLLSRSDFAKACLGVGRYDEAKVVLFELLRDIKELKGVGDQRLFQDAINSLTDVLRTLSVSDIEIEDLFGWLVEHEKSPGIKRSMLRLAYVRELNNNGRFTKALEQEEKLLKELKEIPMGFLATIGDRVKNLFGSGKKGIEPIPVLVLLTDALAEVIYTIASSYGIDEPKLPNNTPSNFPRRAYYYQDGLILAARILGDTHPIVALLHSKNLLGNQSAKDQPLISKEAKTFENDFNSLQEFIPDVLKSHIALSISRVLRRKIYDLRDFAEVRYYSLNKWRDYWLGNDTSSNTTETKIQNHIDQYQAIIDASKLSEAAYDETLQEEVRGLGSPSLLLSAMDGRFGSFLAIIDSLTEIFWIKIYMRNKHIPLTKPLSFPEKQKQADIFSQISKIGIPFNSSFSNPGLTRLKTVSQTRMTGSIEEAAQIIVDAESSTDPRNVNWIRWIRQMAEIHLIAGFRGRNPQEFEKALALYVTVPNTYVSSRALTALYIVQTCAKIAETYYFYRRVLIDQKQGLYDTDPSKVPAIEAQIDEQKQEMVSILNALLTGRSTLASPTKRAKAIIKHIEEYQEDIRQLFETDPTAGSRIYAMLGNFLWWGEQEELEYNKSTGTTSSQMEEALSCYKQALVRDPYNIDALVGSSILSFNQGNDSAALLFFVRALRAIGSKYTPQSRLSEVRSLVDMFYGRGRLSKLSKEQLEALDKAQKYLENCKGELTSWDIERLVDIFKNL